MSTPTVDIRRGWTSASSASYDALCPGRHLAQKNIPEPETTDDAAFGRIVHAALAKGSDEGLTVEQQDIYESCQKIAAKLVDQCFGPDAPKVKVFNEQRLWVKIRAFAGIPHNKIIDGEGYYEHSGQFDRLYRHGTRGLLIDFKTLNSDVPASPSNEQIRDLVVLCSRSLVISEILAAVVQPLVTHDPELVLYDPVSIKQSEDEMFARVRASNNPASPRIPGTEQCKWCRAKSSCVEHAKWQSQNLPAPMSVLDMPVATWTPEQRAMFCERKGAAQKWLDECEAELKKLMKSDENAVPGFYLKPGNVLRPVTDPQELFNRFSALGGTLEQFMQCVGITKERLELQVRNITKAKGKGLKDKVDSMLEGITATKQNDSSIAKRKDKS